MSQKCSLLAHIVQTHVQLLKTAIALPTPKKAQLKVRTGLNEREASGKDVTARPRNRSAQTRSVSHAPSFQVAEAPAKNVKTDTIWQPTLRRQLGVTMYDGLHEVGLFKYAMMMLQFAHVRSFICRSSLRNLLADCFAVGICCISITQQ